MSKVNEIIFDLDLKVLDCYSLQNKLYGPYDLNFLKQVLPADSKTILDIGTGNGSFISMFAKLVENKKIIGIDANPSLIKEAKSNIKNIEFLCDTFCDDTVLPDSPDFIVARFAVEHMSCLENFFNAVKKKLNKNGKLAIIEYYVKTDNIVDPTWKEFRQKEYLIYKQVGSNPNIADSLGSILENSGFSEVVTDFIEISQADNPKAFFELVLSYTNLYSEINNTIFSDEFRDRMYKWANNNINGQSNDAKLIITHTKASTN